MSAKRINQEKVRQAVADYMHSEGCGCCEDTEAHKQHRKRLAELLDVPAHPKEDDYFPFDQYRSTK